MGCCTPYVHFHALAGVWTMILTGTPSHDGEAVPGTNVDGDVAFDVEASVRGT